MNKSFDSVSILKPKLYIGLIGYISKKKVLKKLEQMILSPITANFSYLVLYGLITGELPFEIANISDPVFNRFLDNGFAAIKLSLDTVHADSLAVSKIECAV